MITKLTFLSGTIVFLVVPIIVQAVGVEVVRVGRKKFDSGQVGLCVKFVVGDDAKYSVTWVDRFGRQIQERPQGCTVTPDVSVTSIKLPGGDGPASVTIRTGMEWLRLTIRVDGTVEKESQKEFAIPPLDVDGTLVYDLGAWRKTIDVTHPEVDIFDDYQPFQIRPFFVDAYYYEGNKFVSSNLADTGFFYIKKLGTSNGETRTQIGLLPRDGQRGVVTFIYTTEFADDLVQNIQVGSSVPFYRKDQPGPFNQGQIGVGHPYMGQSVKCNGRYMCDVRCVALSGQDNAVVSISKPDGTKLVSVTQVPGQPLAQITFPPIPEQDESKLSFVCDVTDQNGNQADSRNINVDLYVEPHIVKEQSEVVATDTGFEVLCVVRDYPHQDSKLTFKFEDSSQDQEVQADISYPFWNIQNIHGTLDGVQGDLKGVECRVNFPNSAPATYFIPFKE